MHLREVGYQSRSTERTSSEKEDISCPAVRIFNCVWISMDSGFLSAGVFLKGSQPAAFTHEHIVNPLFLHRFSAMIKTSDEKSNDEGLYCHCTEIKFSI